MVNIRKGVYIEIKMRDIIVGSISGLTASLWTILPFFIGGIQNIFYMTVIAGLLLLFVLTPKKRDNILHTGILAIIVFLATSYVIVPLGSSLFFETSGELIEVEGSETLNLKLPGLFCQGCAYSAENALKGIEGVVDANVDFGTKSGVVVYNPSTVSQEAILSNRVIQAYGGYVE